MKIVVFYPWSDILERSTGAGMRTGLMVDALSERNVEVVVVSPSRGSEKQGNVTYVSYRNNIRLFSSVRGHIRDLGAKLQSRGAGKGKKGSVLVKGYSEFRWLWLHYKHSMSLPFHSLVKSTTRDADAVIIESSFQALPVLRRCRGKRSVLTVHDIISDQITNDGLMKELTLRAELSAFRSADNVVCSSESDREVLNGHGINAELIPHGINTDRCKTRYSRDEAIAGLCGSYGRDFPDGSICLFVGAYHLPNFDAANSIKAMARSMKRGGNGQAVTFVVVGDCCVPGREDNFISLGKVGRQELEYLYCAADIVLVPLKSGTGSSFKTLEAMAYSRPVLGTSIGFRGLPVLTDENCVVSDEISRYPELIMGLLSDEQKRLAIGVGARRFALDYDYHVIYDAYNKLLLS